MLLLRLLVVMVVTVCHLSNGQNVRQDHPPPIIHTNTERLHKLREDALRLAMFRAQIRQALLSGGLTMNAATPSAILSRLRAINKLGNHRVKPIDLRKNPEVLQRLRQNKVPIVVLNPNLISEARKFSRGMHSPISMKPTATTTTTPATATATTTTTTTTTPITPTVSAARTAANIQKRLSMRLSSNRIPRPPTVFPKDNINAHRAALGRPATNTGGQFNQRMQTFSGRVQQRPHATQLMQAQTARTRVGGRNIPVRMPNHQRSPGQLNSRHQWRLDLTQRTNGAVRNPFNRREHQTFPQGGQSRKGHRDSFSWKQGDKQRSVVQGVEGRRRGSSVVPTVDKVDVGKAKQIPEGLRKPTSKEISDIKKKGPTIDDPKLKSVNSVVNRVLSQPKSSMSTGIASSVRTQVRKSPVRPIDKIKLQQPLSPPARNTQTAPIKRHNIPASIVSTRGGIPAWKRIINPIPTSPAEQGISKQARRPMNTRLVIPLPNAKHANLPGPPKLILPLPGIAGPTGSNTNMSFGNRPSLMLPIRIKLSGPASMPLSVRFEAPPVIFLRLHLEFPGGLKIPFRVPVKIDGLALPQNVNVGLGMDVLGGGKVMMPDKKIVKLDQKKGLDNFRFSKTSQGQPDPLSEALQRGISQFDKSRLPWMPPAGQTPFPPVKPITQTARATATATRPGPTSPSVTTPLVVSTPSTLSPNTTVTNVPVTATATAKASLSSTVVKQTTPTPLLPVAVNAKAGVGFPLSNQARGRNIFSGGFRSAVGSRAMMDFRGNKMNKPNVFYPPSTVAHATATATATATANSQRTTGQPLPSSTVTMTPQNGVTVTATATAHTKTAVPIDINVAGHNHDNRHAHTYLH